MENLLFILIIILTVLVFFINVVLIFRFFGLIKQVKYNDYTDLWSIPDYYPKINNKHLKWFLNYITINVIVFIGAFFIRRFPSNPTPEPIFNEKFWYKLIITFMIVTLCLATISIIKKMNFLKNNSFKLHYIEFIIIPIFVISSLYFFNLTFEWFENLYSKM